MAGLDNGGEPRTVTLSDAAYDRLRADLLAGKLTAGAKLGIHDLRGRYAIGASPLREALNRLVADGFVSLTGQRGFRVAPISVADLRDVTRLRIMFEAEALRDSIAVGDDAWEAGIVGAFHRLSKVEHGAANFSNWEERNAAFHDALVAACPSPRLLQFRNNLFDQHKRYRSLSTVAVSSARDIPREHRVIMEKTLARDTQAACAAIAAHIQATAERLEAIIAAVTA
ncbi:MAG: FCD domain-containing protein [Gammaproteobacteria bacterium]|nr:FCD domain-containing protein [Gammaproteobacteria bacterium]